MRYKLSNSIYVNFLGISLLLAFTACGSFQNASYYSDGIYGNVTKVSIQRENVSSKANAYSQYFDEKANQYAWEESPEDTYLTNIDSLNTQQPLVQQQSRSQWGGGNKTTEIYIVDNRMDFGLFPFNVNSFYGYNYGFNNYFDYIDPFFNPYWGGFGWNFNSPFYPPFHRGFNRGFYRPFYGYGFGYAYSGFYSPFYNPYFNQPYWNRNRRFGRNVNSPRRSYAQTYRGERSNARSPRVSNNARANARVNGRANGRANVNGIQAGVDNGTNSRVRANTNSRVVNGEAIEVPNLVRESRTVTARRNIDSQRGQYSGTQPNVRRLNGEGGRNYVPSTRSNTRSYTAGNKRQNESVRTPRQNNNSSNSRSFSTPRNSVPSRSYSAPSRSGGSSGSASRSSGGASRSSGSGRRQ